MIHPGVVSVTFRQLPADDVVRLAARAELSSIEWGGDIHVPHGQLACARQIRTMTLDAGLRVAGYASYYCAGYSEDHGLPFGSVLETAAALGAPWVRVWAGKYSSAKISSNLRRNTVSDLNRIAQLAKTAGIGIATEFHANTLTDTVDSTVNLLRDEVTQANLSTHWQPRHGEDLATAEEGLKAVLPWLRNIHVFHWWPGPNRRLPLEDGRGRWEHFLQIIAGAGGERDALIEFVQNDDPEKFLRDAATLRGWLGKLTVETVQPSTRN
jgi:3-dehydroshikimate dehydratase